MSQVRRGFDPSVDDLYRIDASATGLAECGRLRGTESRAVTEKIRTWLRDSLKTTNLGGAVRYTLGNDGIG